VRGEFVFFSVDTWNTRIPKTPGPSSLPHLSKS
jgi:hypothetical protein